MALQRYRADASDPPSPNGSVAWYANWVGGPTLSLIRSCPVDEEGVAPRTVYVTGEPDTFFSMPAACKVRGKTVKGWIGREESGWKFHPRKQPDASGEVDVRKDVLEPASDVRQ